MSVENVNLIHNPRPSDSSYWRASSAVGTVTFTTTPEGKPAARSTYNEENAYAMYCGIKDGRPPVEACGENDVYTLMYKVRGNRSYRMQVQIGYGNGTAHVSSLAVDHVLPADGSSLEIRRVITVPSGAHVGQPLFYKPYLFPADSDVGDWFEFYDVAWIAGEYDGRFFDGDTPDTSVVSHEWLGAPQASHSLRTYGLDPAPIQYDLASYRSKFLDPTVKVIRRAEILEADGKTLWANESRDDPRLISGGVSVDYSRDERRSLDIQLANFDRELIHKPEGFWYDKTIRVWRGVQWRDSEGEKSYEVPLGTFMIDRVSQPRFPNVIKITARDFTKKCMLSKFTVTTQFVAGTNVGTIIEALAANSGVYDRIIPPTSKVLGTDTTYERGSSRWEAMKALATAFNFELFFNAENVLVMREFIDPTLGPISHTFETGPTNGNLVEWEKTTNDTRIYNWVSVQGTTDAGLPVTYDAKNENPSSPTSIERLGPRVYTFDSSVITTEPQAQELAHALLSVNGLEEYEINMTSLVAPWLEAGEICKFIDPDAAENDPDRFLMTSITIPLGLEPMTAVGRRLTIVGG